MCPAGWRCLPGGTTKKESRSVLLLFYSCRSVASLFGARSALPEVDAGPAGRVRLHFAEDFTHQRCGVALAQEQVAQQVPDRVAFRPFEVALRLQAGRVAQASSTAAIAFGTAGDFTRRIR
jgi:hypothetical protein